MITSTPQINKTKYKPYAIPIIAFAGLLTINIAMLNQDAKNDATALSESTNIIVDDATYYIGIDTSGDSIDMIADATANGTYSSAKDTVTVSTNLPSGYSLYISNASNDTNLYKDGDAHSNHYISSTSGTYTNPQPLRSNTYGYAVPSSADYTTNNNFDSSYTTPNPSSTSVWAALPSSSDTQLIQTTNTANTSGQSLDVYYGVHLNSAVAPGTYTGTITYTALADASSYSIEPQVNAVVNPTVGKAGEEVPLTIVTNLYTMADVGAVTVSFSDNASTHACNDVTKDVSTGILIISCTTPTTLSADNTYNITINIPKYSKTYTISGFEVINSTSTAKNGFKNIQYMQEATYDMCKQSSEFDEDNVLGTTYSLIDNRTNEPYYIRRFLNTCWMVENLYLQGGMTLKSSSSNVSEDYTLPASSKYGFQGSNASIYEGGTSIANIRKRYGATYDGSYFNQTLATGDFGDICPKGWRLFNSEEATILSALINSTKQLPLNSFWATSTGAMSTPILPGYLNYYQNNGSIYNGGETAGWWSSMNNDGMRAGSSYLSNYIGSTYFIGYSIRCVLAQSSP